MNRLRLRDDLPASMVAICFLCSSILFTNSVSAGVRLDGGWTWREYLELAGAILSLAFGLTMIASRLYAIWRDHRESRFPVCPQCGERHQPAAHARGRGTSPSGSTSPSFVEMRLCSACGCFTDWQTPHVCFARARPVVFPPFGTPPWGNFGGGAPYRETPKGSEWSAQSRLVELRVTEAAWKRLTGPAREVVGEDRLVLVHLDLELCGPESQVLRIVSGARPSACNGLLLVLPASDLEPIAGHDYARMPPPPGGS